MSVAARKLSAEAGFTGANIPLGRMLALSILVHLIAFTPFLLPGHGRVAVGPAPILDLNLGREIESAPVEGPAKKPSAVQDETPTPTPPPPVATAELDNLRENARRSLANAVTQPEAVEEASLGLSISRGYFTGIGEGETLRDDIREYYFEILRRINEKWWIKGGNQHAARRRALFYLVIARDGTITDRMIAESSGNPTYDRSMLMSLDASNPLPPLPESYRGEFFQAPIRFNAPLSLMKSLDLTSLDGKLM